MATRLPASQHTREELTALIEGRLSTASAKDELVKLATRLIVEEALEGEAGDALGRGTGAAPGLLARTASYAAQGYHGQDRGRGRCERRLACLRA